MQRAGAVTPGANRISLLRDTDGDGAADQGSVFLAGLHSPFGRALVGNGLSVANTDAVLRFAYPLQPAGRRVRPVAGRPAGRPADCATPTAWPRPAAAPARPASCEPWSTRATSWAATWCPTT
jgi:glucose/arabinose dehydrogenase